MESSAVETLHTLGGHRKLTTEALLDLRALRQHAEELDAPDVAARLGEVAERMESDVFRVAVVGEFKRGKSTLINALLGAEILPADVLPCSATLNRVTYGLRPSAELVFRPDARGERRREVIAAEKLAEYVTKLTPDSERRASEIEEAIVYHPLRFCRDKADIIDTPGLNDDAAMTAVTLSVLPSVDAALFVILAQSPFSGYEADFLNKLLTQDLGRVLFVVNRIDEIRKEADRQRILSVVQQRIEKAVRSRAAELYGEGTPEAAELLARVGKPRVFGVSGADALDARMAGDADLLARSGFEPFEAALERFLAVDRGVVKLLVMADNGTTACRRLATQLTIRRGALGMESEAFEAAYHRTSAELEQLRGQLQSELDRLDAAARHLRDTLRPRTRALPQILIREANAAIDASPLGAEDLGKARVDETVRRLNKAVLDRVQSAARAECERIQIEIERGLQAEIARLVDFGARVEAELSAVELRFSPPAEGARGVDVSTAAGTGAVVGVLAKLVPGGAIVTGALSGAMTGYQVAGARGAAAGAAAGVVSGLGAIMAGAAVISAIGLPLTWPVILPVLAVSGVASSLGARWLTRLMFSGDQVEKFRESFREGALAQLEQDSTQRVAQVGEAVNDQINAAFSALRDRVRAELGGVVEETQRTLDDLRARRSQAQARGEHDAQRLTNLATEISKIEARFRALGSGLRDLAARE